MLTDILGAPDPPDQLAADPDRASSACNGDAESDDVLSSLVPMGYQLLRPDLDLIVEISLRDLIGPQSPAKRRGTWSSKYSDTSELAKVLAQLKQEEHGITVPRGSPGSIKIDYALARQQACHQRIVPILGSDLACTHVFV